MEEQLVPALDLGFAVASKVRMLYCEILATLLMGLHNQTNTSDTGGIRW